MHARKEHHMRGFEQELLFDSRELHDRAMNLVWAVNKRLKRVEDLMVTPGQWHYRKLLMERDLLRSVLKEAGIVEGE